MTGLPRYLMNNLPDYLKTVVAATQNRNYLAVAANLIDLVAIRSPIDLVAHFLMAADFLMVRSRWPMVNHWPTRRH